VIFVKSSISENFQELWGRWPGGESETTFRLPVAT